MKISLCVFGVGEEGFVQFPLMLKILLLSLDTTTAMPPPKDSSKTYQKWSSRKLSRFAAASRGLLVGLCVSLLQQYTETMGNQIIVFSRYFQILIFAQKKQSATNILNRWFPRRTTLKGPIINPNTVRATRYSSTFRGPSHSRYPRATRGWRMWISVESSTKRQTDRLKF